MQTAPATGPGPDRYRADELATVAGISVQALRGYQSKGLLPPPRHEGRVAWYGSHHRERLDRIRQLKERGYSLRMIAEALGEGRHPAPLPEDQAVLRLSDVAERSGVPVELLRALAASGLLWPHDVAGADLFSEADVRFVRNVLELLGGGLSLDDFLRIAHPLMDATGALGSEAVTLWADLVGDRIRHSRRATGHRSDGPDDDSATRVAESLRELARIVGQLVGYHVERAVLDAARADLEARGTEAERAAFTRTLTAAP